jgi:purine-binding chemotaxis protein CheW
MSTLSEASAPATTSGSGTPRSASGLSGLSSKGFSAKRATTTAATAGREFLTFRLGAEEYGIDILKVQEIRSFEPPTKIANAPSYLRGVVNLRGVIVPIVDLRIKFNCVNEMGEAEINSFTVVIVHNVKGRVVGAVVDSVSDVMQLADSAIQPAPEMSAAVIDTSYITGIANVSERLLILMDIEALMSSADMGLIAAIAEH